MTIGVATVCTSTIVACELRYGVAKKGSFRLAERVDQDEHDPRVGPRVLR